MKKRVIRVYKYSITFRDIHGVKVDRFLKISVPEFHHSLVEFLDYVSSIVNNSDYCLYKIERVDEESSS